MTVQLYCPNEASRKPGEQRHRVKWNGGNPFCVACDATPVDTGTREPKQVIVARRDLEMPPGKLAAQAAHAAVSFLTSVFRSPNADLELAVPGRGFTDAEREWIGGSFVKVVLGVDSQEELLDVRQHAEALGLEVHLIVDEGRTVFDGVKTPTCLAVGPDYRDLVDQATGHLHLY